MRVLSLFPSLDPAGGGIQSGGIGLVLASAAAGVRQVVGCAERESTRSRSRLLIDELERAGVPVVTFPQLERPTELADRWSLNFSQIPWIWRHVREFDAVHVHGVWGICQLSGLAAGQVHRVPVVVTAHESLTTYDVEQSRSRARRRQKLMLKELYLRWADLFVLTSELETRESLPAGAPRETIPYPLHERGQPLPAVPPRGQEPDLSIGYLGRIATKKNVPLLIEALALLPERVRLRIAGDGPAELVERTRRRAEELGVSSRVEWLGFVTPDQRAGFLAAIDLLAMPSEFESFGMAAAEAMLAGVPVIVSRRTGVAELLSRHGGGLTIDPEPQALADAVLELERDRERLDGLAAEAQRAICGELDRDRVGRSLKRAYERAADGRRQARPSRAA